MDVDKLNSKESAEDPSLPCTSDKNLHTVHQEEELFDPKLEQSSRPTSPLAEFTKVKEEDATKDKQTVVSTSEYSAHPAEAVKNGTLSPTVSLETKDSAETPRKDEPLPPSESVKLTQSILDAKKLVDSISRCLSEGDETTQLPEVKMVQGNGFVIGPYAKQSITSENVACYFAMPPGNKNEKAMAPPLANSLHLKYPAIIPKKENAFHPEFCSENRNSDSNNSDEDEDVEIEDDENEDWSFDEDEEVGSGKQCACMFKHCANENGNKTPLQRQDSNQDSACASPSPLQGNPFFSPSHVLQCPDCEQSFNCRVDLNRHRMKHITERSFRCSHCDKSFAFSFNLKSHERQHTGEKPYVCNECGLSFVHAFNFHEHRRVHNSRNHFVCSICLKWFNVESKYLLHIRRHSSIKPFKCSICGKAFHRAAGLRAHELIHSSGKGDQQYSCRFCERTFVRLSHKQMHERVHFGEQRFPCLQCGKTFTELAQLKAHSCSSLMSAQRFKCDVCKEAFPTLQLLENHSRLHTPKKSVTRNAQSHESKFSLFRRRAPVGSAKRRFPCKLCCQAFSTKRLLDDHAKIHQRERTPFACKVCSLAFTHSNYLKLHLATHDKDALVPQLQNFGSGEKINSIVETKAIPQSLSLGYESPSSSSGRSRQSSGEHSVCHSPLNILPPVNIKTEPE